MDYKQLFFCAMDGIKVTENGIEILEIDKSDLKKEIEKLTAEIDKLKAENRDLQQTWDCDERSIQYLTKQVKELTAENEKLKEELNTVKYQPRPDIKEQIAYKEMWKKDAEEARKEIIELKKQLKSQEDFLDPDCFDEWIDGMLNNECETRVSCCLYDDMEQYILHVADAVGIDEDFIVTDINYTELTRDTDKFIKSLKDN